MGVRGELIAGRYRLCERVGRGGMGTVWRAQDEHLGRVVAAKELPDDGTDSPDEAVLARAMREGRVAARLHHVHAVTVHDVVTQAGTPYLIMEFLPSRSLSAVLADRGPLGPEETASIGAQVASALAEAHEQGIVHRDVKPGNVLVTGDGLAKIADFGIARAEGMGSVPEGMGSATEGEILAGTPAYLSPEVAGGSQAEPASDVFSLAATLYLAVEGTTPFAGPGDTVALLVRIVHGQPAMPTRAGPLTDPLLAMLRRDPRRRPSMRQVSELLSAVATGRQATVGVPRRRTPPPPGTSRRLIRRTGGRVAAAGAALVLVAAGMLLGAALNAGRSHGNPLASPASSGCAADVRITDRWPGGYRAEVTVTPGERRLTGWKVSWVMPEGEFVSDVWNGTPSRAGSTVHVEDAGWNGTVAEGRSATFGFVARTVADADPAALTPGCVAG